MRYTEAFINMGALQHTSLMDVAALYSSGLGKILPQNRVIMGSVDTHIYIYIYEYMGTYESANWEKQNASYTHFSVSFARLDNECYSPDEHVKCSACGRLASVLENLRSGAPCKDQQGSGWSRVGLSWCPPDSGPRSDRGSFLE